MTDLDPKLTFESFVVGPANRLASAAARRAADSPGTSYNPLFVYSASGLGKSHILTAIAHHSLRTTPGRRIRYIALEGYLQELAAALEAGDRDGFRDRYGGLDILLMDDVQFLAGQNEAQEMLLRTLDQLSAAGSQIVLASDRPPAEINGLDARLLSRFSGGLIVDIGPPEFETRVAILRRKADERRQVLGPGVAEALGRYPFKNVRELGGALNRVLAIQDLEDLTGAAAQTVGAQEEPWRRALREAVDAAEREGFDARRLKAHQGGSEPPGWELLVDRFRKEVQRLRDIDDELDRLGNPWPEAAHGLLKDPDRLEEAEALLTSVRERQRPFPKVGPGPDLGAIEGFPKIAVKAAQQLVGADKPEYNPLYLWSAEGERGRTLLAAAGRTYQHAHPDARMAVTSVAEFAQDFIRALGEGVAGAWRERWWTVDALLVHGVEALSDTERAQDEFFHLFEALKRRGARVMLTGDRPPSGIARVDDRLRSRFEGGLVLEVEGGAGASALELVPSEPQARPAPFAGLQPPATPPVGREGAGAAAGRPATPSPEAGRGGSAPQGPAPGRQAEPPRRGGTWFPTAENVVIHWPRIEELLQEELE